MNGSYSDVYYRNPCGIDNETPIGIREVTVSSDRNVVSSTNWQLIDSGSMGESSHQMSKKLENNKMNVKTWKTRDKTLTL